MGNVEMMQGLYTAFAQGDVATVLGAMDPGIEWNEAEGSPMQPEGETWVGPDAVMNNLFIKLATDWDGFTVNPKEFHDAGDVVIAEGRYTGTYKATGKSLDAQMTHIWRLRDGKVVAFQQYVDTAQVREVMGAS